MGSSNRTRLLSSFCRSLWTSVLFAIAIRIVLFGSLAFAQQKTERPVRELTPPPAARVLAMTDVDARKVVAEALEQGLTEEWADPLAVLAINRSQVVVSELFERIETARQDPKVSEKFVHTMADLLAYSADETALDALMRLAVSDHARFGVFLGRALDYARGRRNPYSLAYYAVGKSSSEVDSEIMRWVETNAQLGTDYRVWAKAIFERNGEAPTETTLLNDPIISRLSDGIPLALQKELLELRKQETPGRPKK